MTEAVGTVQHRRRLGAQRAERVATGEQVANERLAARDQLVGEYVPGTGLEPPLSEQRAELRCTFGSDLEVVVEDDALPVEQEALSFGGRIIQQLVDECDEPLTEAARGVVPLAVPMRVRDDEDLDRGR